MTLAQKKEDITTTNSEDWSESQGHWTATYILKEHSTLIFVNLKPVEKLKKSF